jgi:PEP-CTERM motif
MRRHFDPSTAAPLARLIKHSPHSVHHRMAMGCAFVAARRAKMTTGSIMITFRGTHLLQAAIVGLGLLASAGAQAQATLLAPGAAIAGTSQTSLSQQWWNWAASFPPSASPVTDTTGAYASLGDQGSVFFLSGAGTTDPIVRNVTVRNDQVLFFPLINAVSGYTDQQIADFGLTPSDIRTEATNLLGNASGLFLKLDASDVALPAGAANLLAYRQATGQFDLILPSDDNIFGGPAVGAPAGTYRAFSDGYWVGLAPLANGSYELHFGGHTDRTGPFAGGSFAQDITYRITAVPEPGTTVLLLAGLTAVLGVAARRRTA